MAGNRIKGITIEIGGDTTKLDKALAGVNKTLKDSQSQLKDVNKLLKLDPGNTELLQQKYEALTKSIDATKEKLQTLKTAQEQAQQALASGDMSQSQYDALQREIVATEQDLKSLTNEYKEFGSVAKQQLEQAGQKMQDFGNTVSGIGGKLMPVSTAVAGIGGATVKMASDFEDAMAKVSTIADTQSVPLDTLKDQILDLSNETGIAATDIADNVYNAISAGQKTADAVSFVDNATKLAKAGFTDSASALDILTTTMNAYGLQAEDVTRVSDVLIQTQNLGKTTVGELASSMGKIIPTAKQNGVELEGLAAAYAVMTSNGIATAESTTYMNSMLNELGKTGSKADVALHEFFADTYEGGLGFSDLSEMGYSLTDVLDILGQSAEQNGLKLADMFGSAEAGKAAAVLSDNSEKYIETLGAMGGALGSTETAFEKLDTTSFNTQKALNQLKNTGIELGNTLLEQLGPTIEKVLTKIGEFAKWFGNLDDSQKKLIVTVGMVVAAIGPLLTVTGKAISLGGSVTKIVAKLAPLFTDTLAPAITAVGAPVLALVAVVGTLIAAFTHLWNTNEDFRNKITEIWEGLKSKFEEFGQGITDRINALGFDFENISEVIHSVWEGICNFLAPLFETAFANVSTVIQTALDYILDIIDFWTAVFKGDWKGAFDAIKKTVSDVWNGIKTIFTNSLTALDKITGGKLTDIFNWFKDKFELIKTTVGGALDWVKQKFDNLKLKLPDIKLPHFKIDGELSLNPPSVPKLSVDWYKKAMNSGMILDSPTIFGAAGGKLLGAGEAGPEAVVGVGSLQSMIQSAVGSTGIDTMVSLMQQYLPYLANSTEIRLDSGALVGATARQMNSALGQISAREARR